MISPREHRVNGKFDNWVVISPQQVERWKRREQILFKYKTLKVVRDLK